MLYAVHMLPGHAVHILPGHALQETFRSFLPAARTSSTVLEVEFHPDMSPRPGPLEQGALESPKKLEELDRQEEVLPSFSSSLTWHTHCGYSILLHLLMLSLFFTNLRHTHNACVA